MGLKKAIISASFGSLALAHSTHKRALPVDGTIWTACVTPGVVALTFDDGPFQHTQSIVDQLTNAGHRATFFQNGQNYDSIYNYASTLNSMIAGGHQVASHTWDHADLATLNADQITSEMTQLEAAHQALIGKVPTYMRPPFLSTNALVISTLTGMGYKIIEVDIDTQDWAEAPLGQIQLSIQWYEGNQTAGGSLSLNHDPYQPTADTFVPAIISYLAGKGLKSVPVGECLGDDPANWYRGGSPPASSSSAPPTSSTPGSSSAPPASSSHSGGPTSSSGSARPTGTSGPFKPVQGGDTEPGHGINAGQGALPGHAGQGNVGTPPTGPISGNGTASNSSTTAHPAVSTSGASSTAAHSAVSTSGASSLAGSVVAIGVAALALLL